MASKTLKYLLGGAALVGIGAAVGIGVINWLGFSPLVIGGAAMNEIRSAGNPQGEMTVELNEAATVASFEPNRLASAPAVMDPGTEWPAFNRTVYGDRYSPLEQINTENAANLDVVCEFNTHKLEGFQVAPIVAEGAIFITTAEDVFSIDPVTCEKNWHAHEDSGFGVFPVNRGATYIDGKIIRGNADGYVRAYDAKTGEKLWQSYIADRNRQLWLTMAPVAWDGMVYYGLAGGDAYDNRGRVFGLDANTGEIKWQTFTVPKVEGDPVHGKEGQVPYDEMKSTWGNDPSVPITGGGVWTTISVDPENGHIYVPVGNPAPDFVKQARPGSNLFTNTALVLDAKTGDYVKHISIMKYDWHDWDMSNAPIFYRTRGGKEVLSFAPKDGNLYTFDATSNELLYREPRTTMLNTDVEFEPGGDEVYFCPGSVGGGEWNGAAYDPAHNLVFTGMNDWCASAKIEPLDEAVKEPLAPAWFGAAYINPYYMVGKLDPVEKWAGWVYATDADTGEWKWRAKANYPTLSGLTPTAGGIIAFGDMGGNFRVLQTSDGKTLYEKNFEGAISGGVVTYAVNDQQYIAFASGTAHPQWPVKPSWGKIIVMGLKAQ